MIINCGSEDETLNEYDVVLFNDEDLSLEVNIDKGQDTVWLSLDQISDLFERDKSVISRHIKKIYKSEEFSNSSTVAYFATVQKEGNREIEFSCIRQLVNLIN